MKADIEDRIITIAIDGPEHTRREALSAIRYQLDEIHESIKGLNPQKRVPVPGATHAEPLEYDYLLMLKREGDEICRIKDGNRLLTVNVRQVLGVIDGEFQQKEFGGSVINIGNINIGENAKVGDIVLASEIQKSLNKTESANIPLELKETLNQLAEAVNVMNNSLPSEQAEKAAGDLVAILNEARKSKPNKEWYSVSIKGLITAAKKLNELGDPVVKLAKKVLSLLSSGGAI